MKINLYNLNMTVSASRTECDYFLEVKGKILIEALLWLFRPGRFNYNHLKELQCINCSLHKLPQGSKLYKNWRSLDYIIHIVKLLMIILIVLLVLGKSTQITLFLSTFDASIKSWHSIDSPHFLFPLLSSKLRVLLLSLQGCCHSMLSYARYTVGVHTKRHSKI